ncbi:MAG TPA: DUF190 domain-containing protein [candidate division Zixibacteria bacterium]|nr:DUF190 domain-containing protein [candidate division Zixibacteria bacterium]
MKRHSEGALLRIFVGESDKRNGVPLYEWIVLKARELNIAGATVLRGVMGYGAHSRLHSAKTVRLSEDLPLVIEIVDSDENLDRLLPLLDEVVPEGLITIEKVRMIKYRSDEDEERE